MIASVFRNFRSSKFKLWEFFYSVLPAGRVQAGTNWVQNLYEATFEFHVVFLTWSSGHFYWVDLKFELIWTMRVIWLGIWIQVLNFFDSNVPRLRLFIRKIDWIALILQATKLMCWRISRKSIVEFVAALTHVVIRILWFPWGHFPKRVSVYSFNGILFSKLFWPTVLQIEKNVSKTFKITKTIPSRNEMWVSTIFKMECFYNLFLRSDTLEQFQFKWEKIIGI